MSEAIKTTAIVLRTRRFSESSLIASLLSRDHGRLDVLAKGARREKSLLYGHLDLYQKEDVLVLRRPAAGLDLLTEAAFADEHVGLRFCPPAFAAAGLLAGLVVDATLPGPACPEVFSVLAKSLSVLSELGEAAARAGLTAAGRFTPAEKRLLVERTLTLAIRDTLAALGFGLELGRCVVCGGTAGVEAGAAVSLRAGGLVCRACRRTAPDAVGITPVALRELAGRAGGEGGSGKGRGGEEEKGGKGKEGGERAAAAVAAGRRKTLRLLMDYAQYVLDKPLSGRRVLARLLGG